MREDGISGAAETCISIFRNGEGTTTKEAYTQKWVEIIYALTTGREKKCKRG